MSVRAEQSTVYAQPRRALWSLAGGLTVSQLRDRDTDEVIAFLSERPLHTFAMAGFIRDNGVVSPHNRGIFYSTRGREGQLDGIALIGHAVLFETRTDAAIHTFAVLTRRRSDAHLVLGDAMNVDRFESYYSKFESPRESTSQVLMENRWPLPAFEPVPEFRQATAEELEPIAAAHSKLAFEERGVDPLASDPEGFRARCLRRIIYDRTWVWLDRQTVIFKADLIAQTPDVAYVEGVWANPQVRGKGIALRCVSQLTRFLLHRSRSVCLLVDERHGRVIEFYKRAGFRPVGKYRGLYLRRPI